MTDPSEAPGDATTDQIRGSSLLLGGRLLGHAANMLTQVVVVRALTKSAYGAFAYAFSVETLFRTLVSAGHGRFLSRFLSIYEEERDYPKLFGALVTATASVAVLALPVLGGAWLLRDQLGDVLVDDPRAVGLVLVFMLLAPLEAFDQIFVSMFAVFSRPRMIFFRKHVVGPGVRLVLVAALALAGRGALGFAWAYVVSGAVGIAVYAWIARPVLRERGLLGRVRTRELSFPVREMWRFAIPLFTAELVNISMGTGSVVLLGHLRDTAEVAAYRAVFPAARLNQLVMFSFVALFLPLAARHFARNDQQGMTEAYWRTAVWIAVLSFPIFAVTGPLAGDTATLLFGARYGESAAVLAVLSIGFYFNAVLGFNAVTLQTYGRLRYVVGVNASAAVLNLALAIPLAAEAGAVGVAVSNAATLVVQNLLNQYGLRRLGLVAFPRHRLRPYGIVATAAGLLWLVVALLDPHVAVAVALAAATSAAVLLATRRDLSIADTFPEVRRLPLLGRILG